jgi:UDP-glucuronate decarboxylase
VDTKIARIFNTYGPGMALDDGRLVSNLVVQALTGCSMTLYGDGSQTRSLCYVDDLIEGLVRLMESPATFRGPVNLGNPSETPVLEVAGVIRELTGTSASVVHLALPPDDPRRRCPDITLAQHHLGWWPVTGLREGLRRTIADFVARIKSA